MLGKCGHVVITFASDRLGRQAQGSDGKQTVRPQIASLEQHVLQLRTEKDHVQEQLLIEKRLNAERTVPLEHSTCSISSEGLQDFDPIDMSFLPMWQGLQLSNEKIRAMPVDTLKMLIQTILQDLRHRLSSLNAESAPDASTTLGAAVSAAFAFLNRWCAPDYSPVSQHRSTLRPLPGGCFCASQWRRALPQLPYSSPQP
jgi:hypothetical protein